jgi:hypothetical protein
MQQQQLSSSSSSSKAVTLLLRQRMQGCGLDAIEGGIAIAAAAIRD